jgi:hypothetical protein
VHQQLLLTGIAPSAVNCEYWGDDLINTRDRIFRIAFRNVKSLPMESSNTRHTDILNGDLDVVGLVEFIVAWQNKDLKNKAKERFRGALKPCM